MNSKSTAVKRIMADVRELERHPSSRYAAAPLETNCFEWHFTIRGPSGSDFEGGIYHGRIILPSEYPFKPPNIIFLTKNGRFEVGTKICLSISAYHEETWQPAWGVRTMLEAIISFFPSEGGGAIGALEWTREERQRLARESHSFNCPICGSVHTLLSAEASDGSDQPDSEIAAQISQLKMAAGGAASAASSAKVGGGSEIDSGNGGEKVVTTTSSKEVVDVKAGSQDGTKSTVGSSDTSVGLKEEQSQSTVQSNVDAVSSVISSRSSSLKHESDTMDHFDVTSNTTTNTTHDIGSATTIPPPVHVDNRHDTGSTTYSTNSSFPLSGGSTSTSTPSLSISSPATNITATNTPTVNTSFSTNERVVSSDGMNMDIIPPTPPSLRAVRRQVLAERALERAQRGGDGGNNHQTPTVTTSSSSSAAIGASIATGNVTTTRTTITTNTNGGMNNTPPTQPSTETGTGNAIVADQSSGSRAATNTGNDSSVAVVPPAPPVVPVAPVGMVEGPQRRPLLRQEDSDITDSILGGLQYGIVAAIVAILVRRLLIIWVVTSHFGG